ncbi:hypothetical protein SK3146_00584 [Paenibacillus konkukensis]|uniref:Abortive infection protein n=1 Tax=Paenibacillus konkukensis TaxID=2020716 RepID=A0ABY4RH19_9BACL|nr:hypothetical protein [Paenibacillus konkukensis]UQZ81428.1 hypothetical protein SK3146_00584 [Paenibacillus konkukensis]
MTNSSLRWKGIHYDVGTHTRSRHTSSRDTFDHDIVRREIELIRSELNCNAIRISGQDIERLTFAADCALEQGLSVWFSPAWIDATEPETLRYFAECAEAAEKLRLRSPEAEVIFVAGCELSLFMSGLIQGRTSFDRIQTMMKPWLLLKSTLVKGSFHKRLNRFLARATAEIRRHFHGPVTYASGSWENADWSLFDIVGIDYYRDAMNRSSYRDKLKAYFAYGKPVVVLEFGCCTYRGAEDKGGYGWAIVDHDASPKKLKGRYVRDEQVQTAYMEELLQIFREEGVSGAFWYTFVSQTYPYAEQPEYDLDTASYSVVRTIPGRHGTVYPDMPWEPKRSFYALAACYKE